MQYTTNYNLKLPEGSDFYSVTDFDDNFTTIDAKIKDSASAIAAETARATAAEAAINAELDGVADALAAI